jgi:hypothetical protein
MEVRGKTLPLTSEDRPSAGQDLVECFAEIGGGFGDVAPDLLGVFLPALLDLLLEKLLEVPVAEALLPLTWVVDDHVGDEGPRQAARLEGGVLGEKRVGRPTTGRGPGHWTGSRGSCGRLGRCRCRRGAGRSRRPCGGGWSRGRRHGRSSRRPSRNNWTRWRSRTRRRGRGRGWSRPGGRRRRYWRCGSSGLWPRGLDPRRRRLGRLGLGGLSLGRLGSSLRWLRTFRLGAGRLHHRRTRLLNLTAHREHRAAHGAARPHPGLGHLRRIYPINGGAVWAGDIHLMVLEAAPWSPGRAALLHRCRAAGPRRIPSRATSWHSSSSRSQARSPVPDAQIGGADW